MKVMKMMKALLLFFAICPSLCLFAETPENEACAPVNTRLCEFSLPLDSSNADRPKESTEIAKSLSTDPRPEQGQERSEQAEEQEGEIDCFAESEETAEISNEAKAITQEEAVAKLFYPGCYNYYQHYFFGPTLYQSTLLESGSYLTLENGSIWKMAEADVWRIPGWVVSDRLQLSRNPNLYSPYPYWLRNVENGETIRVVVKVGPRYDSPLFCVCMESDAFTGEVWCSNGTTWWVPIRDRVVLDTWRPHDVVMIGVNEDCMHRECPHLLINLTNGSCCHATWMP